MESNIIKIIRNYVEDNINIDLESKLIEELCIDSLQMMQIICEIERNLKVKISYSKLKDVVKVKDLLNCIQEEI